MVGVIDYGAGNLKSVTNALKYLSLDSIIVSDKKDFDRCSHIILPGVGAFPTRWLRSTLRDFVKR